MKQQLNIVLAIVGTAVMSGSLPYAITDLQGLMPQAIYSSNQWWKTMVLLGMCIGSLPAVWERRLYPMPFALMGIGCVAGTLMALPFVGILAVTKLLVPYGGLCFGLSLAVHVYFKHLDPIEASDPSEAH